MTTYYQRNKEAQREQRKLARQNWTEEQKEAARERQRKFYAKHPDYNAWFLQKHKITREGKRKEREYGLTPIAWEALFEGQGRRCAVCKSDDPGTKHHGGWRTDHDHATGQVRGILCHHCNVVLGHVKDNPEHLRDLADYLELAWLKR